MGTQLEWGCGLGGPNADRLFTPAQIIDGVRDEKRAHRQVAVLKEAVPDMKKFEDEDALHKAPTCIFWMGRLKAIWTNIYTCLQKLMHS